MKKIFLSLTLLISVSSLVKAQFTLTGELRPRSEYSHGYATPANENQDASLFTTQRSRLNFDFKSDKFATYVSLQDVRLWGNQPQLVGNEDNSVSLHQVWAEFGIISDLSLKLGRQEVAYDNQRIFGSVGWAQQARSHDMAILKYESDFKAHLGLAYHENGDRTNNFYDGPDAYKALQFVWLNKKLNDLELSFLLLNNGKGYAKDTNTAGEMTKQGIRYSQTFGPTVKYKLGDLSLNGNFYLQTGKDANDTDISAYEFLVEGAYKITSNISVTGGYELLSGTKMDDTKNKSFTPFYGTNHKFNGFMDYFYVGNHMNNVGLSDLYFKVKYAKDKFWVDGHIHFFGSAVDIPDNSKNLGNEIDIWASYNISDITNLKFGYSQMFVTDSMIALKGGKKGETNNWAWVMLTFKPQFFTTKSAE